MAKSKHIDVSKYNTASKKSQLEKVNEFLSKHPYGPTLTDRIMDNLLKSYLKFLEDKNVKEDDLCYNFSMHARRDKNPSSLEVERKKLKKINFPKMVTIDMHDLNIERRYFREKVIGGFLPEKEYPSVILSNASCFGGTILSDQGIKMNENGEHVIFEPYSIGFKESNTNDVNFTFNQKSIKKTRIEFVNDFEMSYFLSGFFTYLRTLDEQSNGKVFDYIESKNRNGLLTPSMPQFYLETLYRNFNVSYTVETSLTPGCFKILYPLIHNKESGRDILKRHELLDDIEYTFTKNLFNMVGDKYCCTGINIFRDFTIVLDSEVINELTKMTCYINEHWHELLKLIK